jgi:sugar/nucleoside kinase (ribokinase family)
MTSRKSDVHTSSAGATVLEGMRKSGLSTSGIRTAKGEGPEHYRTAQYVAVNDSQKSLVLAMADMDIISSHGFSRDYFIETLKEAQPKCVVVDANLAADSIRSFLSLAADAKVVFEPVSVAKSVRLFDGPTRLDVYPKNQVDLATPNIYELWAMYDAAKERGYFHDAPDWFEVIDRFNISGRDVDYKRHFDRMMAWTSAEVRTAGVPQKVLHLLPYIPSIVVKFGGHGCLLAEIMAPDDPRLVRPSDPEQLPAYIKHQKFVLTQAAPGVSSGGVGGVYMRYYYPSEKVEDIVSVNGVGDTFLGVLAAGLARGVTTHRMIIHAQKAAVMTLRTAQAVSPHLDSLGREVRFKANSWNLSLRKEGRTPAFLAGIRRSDNSWDDVLEAEESLGNKTTVDGLDGADASADVTGEDGHKAAPVASAAGPWLEDEGPTAVQEDTASLLIPTERGPLFQNKSENDVLGSSTTGNDKQPTPLASEEIGSSSANQVGATVETEPKGREAVMDPQPPRQIPAAKLIHKALAKMGMSKEQAEHAIKAVAAEGPHVRRKADYVAKMATQKATAKAEAQKGAKLDNEAQNKQGWGTFARRVQEVVIKDELSVFNKQVVRAAKEHGRARGGSNEKRS